MVKPFQLIFNCLCSSPVAFSDKNCHADARILKTSEFLMSQFMLVMSQQFTITLERTKIPSFYEQIWQLTIREQSWTTDFIVII